MDSLKIIIPVVAVIIGFLLGWLKEYIQHKPKTKLSLVGSESNFDMFKVARTGYGELLRARDLDNPSLIHFNFKLLFQNSGKGDTAITDVVLKITNRSETLYLSNKNQSGRENTIAFNLPSKNVNTVTFFNEVLKNENNLFLFNRKIIEPESDFKVSIIATDINGKNFDLKINPISMLEG